MIRPQHLGILAAILVVLVGLNLMLVRSHRNQTAQSPTEVLLPGEFDSENTARITLAHGAGDPQVVLARGPEGWILESRFGAAADDNRVAGLLDDLSGATGEFRSEGGDVLADYGLDEENCVTVRGFDSQGQEIFALHLGDTPQGFPGQFARIPGSDRVFVTQKSLLAGMGIYGGPAAPRNRHFLQLEVVKEDKQAVDAMRITDGDKVLSFAKQFAVIEPAEDAPEGTAAAEDRSTWEWLEGGEPATGLAKTKIDGVLNACVSIRATDVADPDADPAVYGLDNPQRSVLLTRQDGSTLLLEFGASREGGEDVPAGTYLRVGGKRTVWVATDYTVRNIFKSREDLAAE